MADETQDPREAVLDRHLDRAFVAGDPYATDYEPDPGTAAVLAALDATDPLRAILPEVVEALEKSVAWADRYPASRVYPYTVAVQMTREREECDQLFRATLAQLREFNREERAP